MSRHSIRFRSLVGTLYILVFGVSAAHCQSAPAWYNQPQFFNFFDSPTGPNIKQVPFTGQAWGGHFDNYPASSNVTLQQDVAAWKAQSGVYFLTFSFEKVYGSPNPAWDAFRMRTLNGQYVDQAGPQNTPVAFYSLSSPVRQAAMLAWAQQAVDLGADGLIVDDVASQLGAILAYPLSQGGSFDSVTMGAFQTYLQQKYSASVLAAQFGIADITAFNFGSYIQAKGLSSTWNQQPLTGLSEEFFLFKRQESLSFLRNLVTSTKQYAQQKYGRNFLFTCNDMDIPYGYFITEVMDLTTPEMLYLQGMDHPYAAIDIKSWTGWKRPAILLAETAPPCCGTTSPLSKPTVNLERVIIADIQAAGGIAGATLQMNEGLGASEPVDLSVVNRYANFILGNPQLMSQTTTPARVGLVHSASSALGNVLSTPGQSNAWNGPTNYTGTSRLLLDTGLTYDAVFFPDTSYSQLPSPQAADLAKYSVVIAPSTFALDDHQVATLLAYAQQGGTLLIDGDFATNEPGGAPASHPELKSFLAAPGRTAYGAGEIVFSKELFGVEYQATSGGTLPGVDNAAERQGRASFLTFIAPYIQPDVQVTQPVAQIYEPGITPFMYHDRAGNTLVHLVNYDYNLASDQFYTKTNIQVQVQVGSEAVDEVILRSPDFTGAQTLPFTRNGGTITVTVPEVDAWVVLYFQQNAFAPVISSATPATSLGAVGGSSLSFNVVASDPDGNPLTYTWSVNGQVVTSVFGPIYSLQLPLTAAGLYTVTVTVTDGSRIAQTGWTVNVAAYRAPRVLFDETHAERNTLNAARAQQLNPQHPTWVLFSILGHALAPNYQVTDLLNGAPGSLTAQVLSGTDVLVLAAPDTPLTAAENQAIAQFVQAGGRLIFLGSAHLNTSINTLIGPWGTQFDGTTIESAQGSGCAVCFPLASFATHPAIGPNPSFGVNYGGSLTISQGSTALGKTSAAAWKSVSGQTTQQPGDPNGPFVMVGAAQFGGGRVFVVGDSNFWDDTLQYSSNAGNLNLFLSGLAWLSSSVNAVPPPAASSPKVSITSVNAAGATGSDSAPNDWIEIRGTNLTPASIGPAGMTWSSAPDFASGRMPTSLSGVSVTVNGRPAFVYFISATQINALSPLDNTTGPVQVVVTNNGTSSAPFAMNMRSAAPSFPLVGTTQYVVATHADYSLVGPTSLSSPGYPFTPAQPGETIILYGFGFGLPTTALVNGSSSQSGPLPSLPVTQIGGLPATVTFAGVISPGLYQLNVIVPSAAQSGDNSLTCTYNGSTSPTGDLIAVQR